LEQQGDNQLVVFSLEEQRYALHLNVVERIVRAVEVTALPKAPEIVLGIINFEGRIIPVLNVRKRLNFYEKEIGINDQLLIAQVKRGMVALQVDTVSDVISHDPNELTSMQRIVSGTHYVEGTVSLPDGIVLIHNLDTFLSIDEERALDEAML
jgi:purine-binding chemotaxis protein CheW